MYMCCKIPITRKEFVMFEGATFVLMGKRDLYSDHVINAPQLLNVLLLYYIQCHACLWC